MRDNTALSLCTIEQFKDVDGPRIFAFCNLLEKQVPIFQKALGRAFDLSIDLVNLKTEVGVASSNDKFKIAHLGA